MIELILDAQCTACGECVTICPSNVFDSGPGGVPVLARQQDCQTCFLCELYCETDALFVHPDATATHDLTAIDVATGDYRRDSGWGGLGRRRAVSQRTLANGRRVRAGPLAHLNNVHVLIE
ncbi:MULTISPECIES: ferredoxin family protein [Asaia]|uniref:ferredoxin family protein n=1 Tax=Asaia TaxID=91914 RepID=UPI002FC365ED